MTVTYEGKTATFEVTVTEAEEPEPAKPDYDALKAAIAAAEKLVEGDYTAESWAAVEEALADAKAALTSTDQAEVDAAAKALVAATDALVREFTIVATAGEGGSITPAGEQVVVEGGSVSFVIKADAGYKISDVKVDGKSAGDIDSFEFTGISSDHTIEATFVKSTEPEPGEEDEYEAMFRLYNQWTGEHFYTADEGERDSLIAVGWTDEGIGWYAPTEGTPVYRLYNSWVAGGDHHYTLDAEERDVLMTLGWTYEGEGWMSASDADGEPLKGAVPLYRQYNPYATTGTHNYTADEAENDALVEVGWRAEGIAWYRVPAEE